MEAHARKVPCLTLYLYMFEAQWYKKNEKFRRRRWTLIVEK